VLQSKPGEDIIKIPDERFEKMFSRLTLSSWLNYRLSTEKLPTGKYWKTSMTMMNVDMGTANPIQTFKI
jgi:hypothetical protein